MAAQDTTDTRTRFGFFLEHAGYATPPGRAACALGLARAEAAFEAACAEDGVGGARIVWEPDDDPDLSWADAETLARLEDGSLVCLCARIEVRTWNGWDPCWRVAASLCGIVVESERDPYCRVVAAELAAEAGFGEDEPERASAPPAKIALEAVDHPAARGATFAYTTGAAWAIAHVRAVDEWLNASGRRDEDGLLKLVDALEAYAGQGIEWPDSYLTPELGAILSGFVGLLSGPTGRLDGGTLDSWARGMAERIGWDLDTERMTWDRGGDRS